MFRVANPIMLSEHWGTALKKSTTSETLVCSYSLCCPILVSTVIFPFAHGCSCSLVPFNISHLKVF